MCFMLANITRRCHSTTKILIFINLKKIYIFTYLAYVEHLNNFARYCTLYRVSIKN